MDLILRYHGWNRKFSCTTSGVFAAAHSLTASAAVSSVAQNGFWQIIGIRRPAPMAMMSKCAAGGTAMSSRSGLTASSM